MTTYIFTNKGKVFLIIFIISFLILATVFFKKTNEFNIIEIQKILSFGHEEALDTQIEWQFMNDKIIGKTFFEDLQYQITYILQSKSIESILIKEQVESSNILPCLSIIHLLDKKEVETFYKSIASHNIKQNAQGISIGNNKFIDYSQISDLEFRCKIYYK